MSWAIDPRGLNHSARAVHVDRHAVTDHQRIGPSRQQRRVADLAQCRIDRVPVVVQPVVEIDPRGAQARGYRSGVTSSVGLSGSCGSALPAESRPTRL
jgi:hypothetical protein